MERYILTTFEQAEGVGLLPLLEQRVLADIWHITLDHSCLEQPVNQAMLNDVSQWLDSQDWEQLQPKLSHLANVLEPLLVLSETPQQEEPNNKDEGETL